MNNPLHILKVFSAAAVLTLLTPHLHAQQRSAVLKVPPIYPPIARQMHLQGTVKVTLTVDPTGKVTDAQSDSLLRLLVPAALEAVKHWKFTPADSASTLVVNIVFAN